MKFRMWRGPCSGAPGGGKFVDRHAFALAFGKELAVPDHALVGVELVGDLPVLVPDQAANLQDHLGLAEIDHGQLGVGRLALVLVAEATAEADDALRRRAGGQGPAADVELVRSHVADLAVAKVPRPVPIVMHEIGAERLHGAGPSQRLKSSSWGGSCGSLVPILSRDRLA